MSGLVWNVPTLIFEAREYCYRNNIVQYHLEESSTYLASAVF